MSRKSEFSNGFSFESPSVECELPHHFQTLRGRCFGQIVYISFVLIAKARNANVSSSNHHDAVIITRGNRDFFSDNMFENFRERSHEPENLDKGSYTPEEYE